MLHIPAVKRTRILSGIRAIRSPRTVHSRGGVGSQSAGFMKLLQTAPRGEIALSRTNSDVTSTSSSKNSQSHLIHAWNRDRKQNYAGCGWKNTSESFPDKRICRSHVTISLKRVSQHAAAQTACSDLTDARWQKLTHNQILLFSTAQRHFARALPDFCTKISQSNQSQISQITFWKSVSRVNDYWTLRWWPSCCRVPAALYFFWFFTCLLLYTTDTAHINTPKYVHTGLKNESELKLGWRDAFCEKSLGRRVFLSSWFASMSFDPLDTRPTSSCHAHKNVFLRLFYKCYTY